MRNNVVNPELVRFTDVTGAILGVSVAALERCRSGEQRCPACRRHHYSNRGGG